LKVKYASLYEGQVEGRSDSPAHQVEHLETAIRLLAKRKINLPDTIDHLDLRTLLDTGIPIDLPENRRLIVATIRSGSSCLGEKAMVTFSPEQKNVTDLVAVFRGNKLIFPTSNLRFQLNDRLLLIVASDAVDQLRSDIAL
jgi:CIC family chloride channel protein